MWWWVLIGCASFLILCCLGYAVFWKRQKRRKTTWTWGKSLSQLLAISSKDDNIAEEDPYYSNMNNDTYKPLRRPSPKEIELEDASMEARSRSLSNSGALPAGGTTLGMGMNTTDALAISALGGERSTRGQSGAEEEEEAGGEEGENALPITSITSANPHPKETSGGGIFNSLRKSIVRNKKKKGKGKDEQTNDYLFFGENGDDEMQSSSSESSEDDGFMETTGMGGERVAL